ncbi:MAG: carbohydrate binding family 9 domain-containing protein [Deltaproteobacteria bacterium]|nr:carbohydrate binding family 9 domain-containing protein [Deltaproteobacteria bacterium]
MSRTLCFACLLVVASLGGTSVPAAAADNAAITPVAPAMRAVAVRRSGSITIDGHLDERAWTDAPKHSGFTQRQPKSGAKADLETRFAILYDDAAIYVGVWADDPEPHRIRRLLTRRDVDAPADAVAVAIDSYHDKRTAYLFQLNAAGVQRDMLLFDDVSSDDTWDAVWTGNVSLTDKGWCAEFRIPLNQLRFSNADTQEWGFQVMRSVPRTQELATWSPWPITGDQVVSRFGVVGGIEHVKQQRRLELLPYATGGFSARPVEAGDPLHDSFGMTGNAGLDLKYGLGSAFTLSATINPDFGQVEADPSQVNLSANELFFSERRPFFLEGTDLFRLPISTTGGGVESVFYSRRIGAAPGVEPDNYQYLDQPTSTRIYTAAKLTGKTRDGWSVGVLDAVTGQESATIIDGDGNRAEPIVAPLTNYALARVKRDLRGGKTSIGGSASAVHRALADTPLEMLLHDQAYTAGAQLQHRSDNNAWVATMNLFGSYVHGAKEAIARTQRSQRHLFQRPDNQHQHFDPERTSMSGLAFGYMAGKLGDTKRWRYGVGGDVRTAGLELNDLGFQNSADRAVNFIYGEYHNETPGPNVLAWSFNADVFAVNTLEPRLGSLGFECNGRVQLVNYWTLGAGCNLETGGSSPGFLRGGPALNLDANGSFYANINTDSRKRVQAFIGSFGWHQPSSQSSQYGFDVGLQIQARSNIDIFVGPGVQARNDALQFVDAAGDERGRTHYVLGRINQMIAALTLRVNWTFSPEITLQAYAQPFVATGRYSEFKDVVQPGAAQFDDRYTILDGTALSLSDGVYSAQNGGRFQFGRPDFNFRQLRSTVVFRWQYRPGSTVFAIWSHGRTSASDDGRFFLGRDLRGLGEVDGENLVMVKANYWIGF